MGRELGKAGGTFGPQGRKEGGKAGWEGTACLQSKAGSVGVLGKTGVPIRVLALPRLPSARIPCGGWGAACGKRGLGADVGMSA